MDFMPAVLALGLLNTVLLVVVLVRRSRIAAPGDVRDQLVQQRLENGMESVSAVAQRTERAVASANEKTGSQLREVRELVTEKLDVKLGQFDNRFRGFQELVGQSLQNNTSAIDSRLTDLNRSTGSLNESLKAINTTLDARIKELQDDNARQLTEMRSTVDEKLQETLNARITESFRLVNERLQQVDQGLGEVKGLAQDVGGLKKVLSNVKARGIVGEIQLGAILKEILSPSQFEENVETIAGSDKRVEFAVKLPGEGGETVWLPIDSKFPGDTYEHLCDAQESGDADAVAMAWKNLETRIKQEAKDIKEKYVAPPQTTSFGILFLPFEGLYVEVVNRSGLVELLQRQYGVNVAGPSTMAALLNSLQMGFQTVAIQQRADEIQQVLSAVKTEFGKYQTELEKAQKQIGTASKTIDQLVGRRSRAMERRLRGITELESLSEAECLLGIEDEMGEGSLDE